MRRFALCVVLTFNVAYVFAQQDKAGIPITLKREDTVKSVKPSIVDSSTQVDLIDILKERFFKQSQADRTKPPHKFTFSLLPSVGYSLSTGFAANLSGNVLFNTGTDKSKTNASVVNASGFVDTYSQRSLLFQTDIWSVNNEFNFTTDFRWLKYPGETYGLGGLTTPGEANDLNYNYVKLYETVLKKIIPDYYIGFGYNLDFHTNITQAGNQNGTVSDLTKYGDQYSTQSSGFNIDLLFDKRGNPINPVGGGGYANIIFRQNFKFLGSDRSWKSLIIDLRKYVKTSDVNNNVLAFWTYLWFTYDGTAPYLDLPSTAWDPNGSIGRGYAEGRFRGKDLLYEEAEYRFGITHNGLLGGVLFANAQMYPEYPSGDFKKVIPAVGTGLRIKLNKHSNTNICIDYGVGIEGSRGVFVNLGEGF